jgi:hypothetical protein
VGSNNRSRLQADCSKCCGLCCVAPPFDVVQGFGISKPAHEPCVHLRQDFACAIHAELAPRGFPACVVFDCYGAGQRVTQELFGGRNWRESADLARRMFAAYSTYRALHELMAILTLALQKVPPESAVRLRERLEAIEARCNSGAARTETPSLGTLRREVLGEIRRAMSER